MVKGRRPVHRCRLCIGVGDIGCDGLTVQSRASIKTQNECIHMIKVLFEESATSSAIRHCHSQARQERPNAPNASIAGFLPKNNNGCTQYKSTSTTRRPLQQEHSTLPLPLHGNLPARMMTAAAVFWAHATLPCLAPPGNIRF